MKIHQNAQITKQLKPIKEQISALAKSRNTADIKLQATSKENKIIAKCMMQ